MGRYRLFDRTDTVLRFSGYRPDSYHGIRRTQRGHDDSPYTRDISGRFAFRLGAIVIIYQAVFILEYKYKVENNDPSLTTSMRGWIERGV